MTNLAFVSIFYKTEAIKNNGLVSISIKIALGDVIR